MADLNDMLDCLRNAKAQFQGVEGKLQIARDASALRTLRIQQQGLDNSFDPYTATTKKSRTRKGLQIGHVDYTDTGSLWKQVEPKVFSNDGNGKVVITVEPEGDRKEIAGYLEALRPGSFEFTEEEVALSTQANINRGNKILEECVNLS